MLFYLQVFVNPVGLVELESCCEKQNKTKKEPQKTEQPAGRGTALSNQQVAAWLAFVQPTMRPLAAASRTRIELSTHDIVVESSPFDFIFPASCNKNRHCRIHSSPLDGAHHECPATCAVTTVIQLPEVTWDTIVDPKVGITSPPRGRVAVAGAE